MTRVRRQIPVPEADGDPDNDRIWCNWADCDNPASSLFVLTECYASRRDHSQRPRRPLCPGCRRVAFCCAQHMDYYDHSHIQHDGRSEWGMLSPGVGPRYL